MIWLQCRSVTRRTLGLSIRAVELSSDSSGPGTNAICELDVRRAYAEKR
jgi:hypothetical protein